MVTQITRTRNYKEEPRKIRKSFAETKAEFKALNSRMNNTKGQISDLKDIIMEITQAGQQTESQIKKKKSTAI